MWRHWKTDTRIENINGYLKKLTPDCLLCLWEHSHTLHRLGIISSQCLRQFGIISCISYILWRLCSNKLLNCLPKTSRSFSLSVFLSNAIILLLFNSWTNLSTSVHFTTSLGGHMVSKKMYGSYILKFKLDGETERVSTTLSWTYIISRYFFEIRWIW